MQTQTVTKTQIETQQAQTQTDTITITQPAQTTTDTITSTVTTTNTITSTVTMTSQPPTTTPPVTLPPTHQLLVIIDVITDAEGEAQNNTPYDLEIEVSNNNSYEVTARFVISSMPSVFVDQNATEWNISANSSTIIDFGSITFTVLDLHRWEVQCYIEDEIQDIYELETNVMIT
jgi:hypothetical protein